MKPITLWYRYDPKSGSFEYNHYEDGWDHLVKPLKVMVNGDRWAKEAGFLDGEKIKYLDKS